MLSTLKQALDQAETVSSRGYTFLDNELAENHYPFSELVRAAKARGRHFQALGLRKGDRVAMIIPEGEDFVLAFLGAVSVGVVPVPMYPPLALGALDGYMESAARIIRASGARFLLTTPKVSPLLWSLLGKGTGLEDIVLTDKLKQPPPAGSFTVPEIGPDDLCFLQFTSGSTADPKGVMVTHGNLIANGLAIMNEGLASDNERDRGVSWLPLYHDMGLIGFVIAPLCVTVPVVFMPTLAFVKRPNLWLETVSKYRGTITFAPNFAFALAAKRLPRSKVDLSSLRVVGCGAEPINAETMRTFVKTFAPMGLDPNAIMPCYGMAEATLAMSFEPLDRPFHAETIDRAAYENENAARRYSGSDPKGSLELVACGRAFANHGLGVMDASGKLLPDGKVGEIVFRGPSVSAGYFKNTEATAATIKDGWLHTGDLGFMLDGRIFISGRQKDIIILNGRNYYPQAIEWEAEKVEGIRKGNVVAFAVRGESTEKLIVVAETKAEDRVQLAQAVTTAVQGALGVSPAEVVLVGPGNLPKTSSGKLQRRKTKAQYEDGSLGQLGNRTLGSAGTRATIAKHITTSVFARIKHKVRRFKLPGTQSATAAGIDQERS